MLPFLLVVDAGGGEAQVQALVRSLQLDGVTARFVASSSWWRVARGGESREELEEMAERTRAATGLRVSVLATADLAQGESPRGLLGAGEDGRWCLAGPGWQGEEQEVEWVEGRLAAFSLALPGTVVIRRYRHHARRERSFRKTGAVRHEGRERRVGVLDLHGAEGSLRIVSGSTDFTHLPGEFQGVGPRSFALFLSKLGQEMEVLGRRICEPSRAPSGVKTKELPEEIQITGWPVWEEHSRICASHLAHRR